MPEPPTVFVVDDDKAVRESLRWLIESIDLRVETYDSAKSFLAHCDADRPGCLVLDVRMPGMTGLELQEHLEARGITLPVIVITAYGDVPTAVRAMRQNAVDFLEKPFNDGALLELIQHCIERDAAARRSGALRRGIRGKLAKLTPREREVLALVCAGKSNKEAAQQLGVSPKTIEVHRSRVMDKMEAASFADLVQMVSSLEDGSGKP
jgi:RNA polymerase sigma factor (sigma-70 family)